MPTDTTPAPPARWASNTDGAALAAWLRQGREAVLLTHSKPDGDAAGSVLALARTLRLIGIEARAWFIGPAPRWLAEVAGETPYEVFRPGAPVDSAVVRPANPDRVVVLDTGSWSQLSELRPWLSTRREHAAVIDHHLRGDPDVASRLLVSTEDAAAAQVLAPVCCGLLGRAASGLPLEVAEPLYLGLGTDTGWFRHSNVKPGTLRLAADLIEAGVDHTRLYALIEQRDGPARWKLLGRALSSLELHEEGRVALMTLRQGDFAECGADPNDTGGFADMVLSIETVRVAVLLTEEKAALESAGVAAAPLTKVSMRSKPGGHEVDVNAATNVLGGGGHARAAGAKMAGVGLAEARERVLAVLGEQLGRG